MKKISPAKAKEMGLIFPLYHGTTEENRCQIRKDGFKVIIGEACEGNIEHGYPIIDYHEGIPPPVHHLGFGIYLTTVKSIAIKFNGGTSRGLVQYAIAAPRFETINFGANSTMMKWWKKNGYNMPSPSEWSKENPDGDFEDYKKRRLDETLNLTKTLASKFDAVWFKGKSLYKLLDGDQICVFDPDRIYEIDYSLAGTFEIGSVVVRKSDGNKGVITSIRKIEDQFKQYHPREARYFVGVRFKRNSKDPIQNRSRLEYYDHELEFL